MFNNSSSGTNRGNCPICRKNFCLNKVIPLLTLDGIDSDTAASINKSDDVDEKHVETKNLLKSILSSLGNVTSAITEVKDRLTNLEAGSLNLSPSSSHIELKTREAIIESLKMHVEHIKKPQGRRGVFYNQNCMTKAHSSNYDDSGINAFIDDLEDDELEFNLRI